VDSELEDEVRSLFLNFFKFTSRTWQKRGQDISWDLFGELDRWNGSSIKEDIAFSSRLLALCKLPPNVFPFILIEVLSPIPFLKLSRILILPTTKLIYNEKDFTE